MRRYNCKISGNSIKKAAILLCACMLAFSNSAFLPGSKEITAYAEEATIVALSAAYSGPSVMLGKEIDTKYLTVAVTYSDGVTDIIEDYTVVSKVVAAKGTNIGTVIYQGKTANYYVQGKMLKGLFASYTGPSISIGNTVAKKNIYAMAEYDDGSFDVLTDYTVIPTPISEIGKNKIPVTYEGQVAYIEVTGVAPKTITTLYAAYHGGDVTVGSSVNPSDLIITAVYSDGSSEEINNYELTPAKVSSIGVQNVVAFYHGSTVSFSVNGTARKVTGLKAEYKGNPIGVGYKVRNSDITVMATFNDGATEEVKDFNVLNPTGTYEGYHVMTVEYEGYTSSFIIMIVSAATVDYSNASTFRVTNGTNTATVAIAMPKNVAKSSVSGASLRSGAVSSVLSRAVRQSKFIAFEVKVNDDDVIDEFPLVMKITIPNEFNIDYTSLYYTSNRKSIIGKMNTDDDGKKTMTCTIYHPGTYILSYKK